MSLYNYKMSKLDEKNKSQHGVTYNQDQWSISGLIQLAMQIIMLWWRNVQRDDLVHPAGSPPKCC